MTDIQRPTPLPDTVAKEFADYAPLLQQLLYNRGITTRADAEQFLYPSYDEQLHDPFLLHDMSMAVDRICAAVSAAERIVIFSDYDCDGIPGGVVLHDFFSEIAYAHFHNVIPHRHYDGFGLSIEQVDQMIAQHNPDLIITIDCGTSDQAAIAHAASKGVDVIVTDHHEPPAVLPPAVAIVNPKLGDTYPFTELCGAAVVYKLVQALLSKEQFSIPAGKEKWWLDMVGIATIADMVPLRGENRVLAHYGMRVLRKTRRPGLQHLLRKQRVDQRYLNEDDIGFTIGPRINAASRMDTPEDAFNMLASKDESESGTYVTHLEKLNNERKAAVATMTKALHKRVRVTTELPEVLVFGNPEWRPSLVGLAANKLSEEYNRPAFLWGRDGNDKCKGSCRSNGVVSVVRLMEGAEQIFSEYGGHHMSGGFTVLDTHIHSFSHTLNQAYRELGAAAAAPRSAHQVDAVITLEAIDNAFMQAQRMCSPFGCENPKPLYLLESITPTAVEVFGKQAEHTKLLLGGSALVKEAIAFFKLPEDFTTTVTADTPVSLLVYVEDSYFMNRHQVRLRIVDVI